MDTLTEMKRRVKNRIQSQRQFTFSSLTQKSLNPFKNVIFQTPVEEN